MSIKPLQIFDMIFNFYQNKTIMLIFYKALLPKTLKLNL